jgi:outer membrane PBP1 activator LpoA protein
MTRVQWIFRSIAAASIALLLAGCPSLGPRGEVPPNIDRAEQLAREGKPAEAARVYEALAQQNAGADRTTYSLRAAAAYLKARQAEDAARVLAQLQPPFTPDQTIERQMLTAELALLRGQSQQAWQQLAAIPEPKTAPAAIRYWDIKKRAAFAVGRPVDAVRAHNARERYLTNPEDIRAGRVALLAELREASERGVKVEPRAAPDPLTRGWLELAAIAATAARSPAAAIADVQGWQRRYPSHPANDAVNTEILGRSPAPVTEPGPVAQGPVNQVALLLPLSGRQASAATTVRDGFLTAFFLSPVESRPRVRIYDTATISAADAVTRATQDGAQFIVGPLTRDEVAAAADLATPRPPILALNFLPAGRTLPNAFYQFALSPEDEAREAARRILADGHRRGIVLVPDGDWGVRVLTAFREELEAGGGALLDTTTFDASQTDYSQSITQVLRLTDSRARHRRLESVLGTKLQFEPRRRSDIEFIFAASQASTARLLRPQLKFHFAGGVPTYATSDAYEPDPNANQDMDGLIFPDMPWMLGGQLAEAVRTSTREAWPSGGPRRNRLFAFGFDAYRLLTALRDTSGAPINVEGLTGRLSLDAERHVRRELDWAQMQKGQPRPLPPPAQSIATPPPQATAN